MNFQVGDVVTIRPSQQLYWKLRLGISSVGISSDCSSENFRSIIYKDATVAEFDDVWNRVYDWGDISLDNEYNGKKVCWIETI